MERLLGRADAAGGLHADGDARGEVVVADGLQHHLGVGEGGVAVGLARAGFDEVAWAQPRAHREETGGADLVVAVELAGFEDDFQADRLAAGFEDGGDFVADLGEMAGEEGVAVDDHVDFVRAVVHGPANFGQARAQRRLAARESGGHARDAHGRPADVALRGGDEGGVNADGGDRRDLRIRRVRTHGLGAKLGDFPRGVLTFEGGQIDHGHRRSQAPEFGGLFEGTGGEPRRPGFDAYLVNGADVIQQTAHGERGGHPGIWRGSRDGQGDARPRLGSFSR